MCLIFNFNTQNTADPLSIFLCTLSNEKLCELNAIDNDSCSLQVFINNQGELTFDYYKYIETEDGTIKSNGYSGLRLNMNLMVENVGLFKIKSCTETYDGSKTYKSVTANSLEYELEHKTLNTFLINTGLEDSYERLIEFEKVPSGGTYVDETELLLNPYTSLPYDYIVIENTFADQLTDLLDTVKTNDETPGNNDIVEGATYASGTTQFATIEEYISRIPRLRDTYTLDNDGSITSSTIFITENKDANEEIISVTVNAGFKNRITYLIGFYQRNGSKFSLIKQALDNANSTWTVDVEKMDSAVVNKKCQFNIDSENLYSFLTQDVASQISAVARFDIVNRTLWFTHIDNLGEDSSVILSHSSLVNSDSVEQTDENIITRYNVSGGNKLGILDVNFGSSRITDISYFLGATDDDGNPLYVSSALKTKYEAYENDVELLRPYYIEYATEYAKISKEIYELTYRVPNDLVKTDWSTYTETELYACLREYTNLVKALKVAYLEDYPGDTTFARIENTPYWYDYFEYRQVIRQIQEAILDISNNSATANTISTITNDQDMINVIESIDDWKTEWSLYGLKELESKSTAYQNQLDILISGGAVVIDSGTAIKTWDDLTNAEKKMFSSEEAYTDTYTEYNTILDTKTACDNAISERKTEITNKEALLSPLDENMGYIKIMVDINKYSTTGVTDLIDYLSAQNNTQDDEQSDEQSVTVTWNPDDYSPTFSNTSSAPEIDIIESLYIDGDYSNENILITSRDDVETMITLEQELLDDAVNSLSADSRPQLTYSANIGYLLCMPEFKDYDFSVGNYVYLEYLEGEVEKLRLNSITVNPVTPENNLEISFTSYIESRANRSDLAYILGQASNGGVKSSGNGGNGGSMTMDDVDAYISNTLLNKLLNTETFGTKVSNVVLNSITVNELNATYAKFGTISTGAITSADSSITLNFGDNTISTTTQYRAPYGDGANEATFETGTEISAGKLETYIDNLTAEAEIKNASRGTISSNGVSISYNKKYAESCSLPIAPNKDDYSSTVKYMAAYMEYTTELVAYRIKTLLGNYKYNFSISESDTNDSGETFYQTRSASLGVKGTAINEYNTSGDIIKQGFYGSDNLYLKEVDEATSTSKMVDCSTDAVLVKNLDVNNNITECSYLDSDGLVVYDSNNSNTIEVTSDDIKLNDNSLITVINGSKDGLIIAKGTYTFTTVNANTSSTSDGRTYIDIDIPGANFSSRPLIMLQIRKAFTAADNGAGLYVTSQVLSGKNNRFRINIYNTTNIAKSDIPVDWIAIERS